MPDGGGGGGGSGGAGIVVCLSCGPHRCGLAVLQRAATIITHRCRQDDYGWLALQPPSCIRPPPPPPPLLIVWNAAVGFFQIMRQGASPFHGGFLSAPLPPLYTLADCSGPDLPLPMLPASCPGPVHYSRPSGAHRPAGPTGPARRREGTRLLHCGTVTRPHRCSAWGPLPGPAHRLFLGSRHQRVYPHDFPRMERMARIQ